MAPIPHDMQMTGQVFGSKLKQFLQQAVKAE